MTIPPDLVILIVPIVRYAAVMIAFVMFLALVSGEMLELKVIFLVAIVWNFNHFSLLALMFQRLVTVAGLIFG